jgi:subtilase family serine protease
MIRQGLSLAGLSMAAAAAFGALPSGGASAQITGRAMTPDSSMERPGDVGVRYHTNIEVFVTDQAITPFTPPFSGTLYGTPASVGCAYKLTATSTPASGCDPNKVTANPTGGARAIAIVDAFDDPTAAADLKAFSTQFKLAKPNFTVVKIGSPGTDPGWALEESLDIEWAHAMAPNAKIYLVEATTNSVSDLFKAVAKANALVAAAGGGEVSMSWGGSETAGQSSNDVNLKQKGVVYFAAAGNSPAVSYPAASPFVVSVGGTGLSYNLNTDKFQAEVIWQSTGGGPSAFYPRPHYQNGVSGVTGPHRGTPDVAAIADPTTGVWVYCSEAACGGFLPWWIVGGTSAATQIWAGIVNSAGHFRSSTNAELSAIYPAIGTAAFRDITIGSCGPFEGYLGLAGYDFCTGVGSPLGKTVK